MTSQYSQGAYYLQSSPTHDTDFRQQLPIELNRHPPADQQHLAATNHKLLTELSLPMLDSSHQDEAVALDRVLAQEHGYSGAHSGSFAYTPYTPDQKCLSCMPTHLSQHQPMHPHTHFDVHQPFLSSAETIHPVYQSPMRPFGVPSMRHSAQLPGIDTHVTSMTLPYQATDDPLSAVYNHGSDPTRSELASQPLYSSHGARASVAGSLTGAAANTTPTVLPILSFQPVTCPVNFCSTFQVNSSAVGGARMGYAMSPATTFPNTLSPSISSVSMFSPALTSTAERDRSNGRGMIDGQCFDSKTPMISGMVSSPSMTSDLSLADSSEMCPTAPWAPSTSRRPASKDSPNASEDGRGKVQISRVPKKDKHGVRQKLTCSKCEEQGLLSRTFKGAPELKRHKQSHTGEMFICHDVGLASDPKDPCPTCESGKLYARPDNAIGHLRRKHFNRIKNDKTQKSRGGSSGGDWPPVAEIWEMGCLSLYKANPYEHEKRSTNPDRKPKRRGRKLANKASTYVAAPTNNDTISSAHHPTDVDESINIPVASTSSVAFGTESAWTHVLPSSLQMESTAVVDQPGSYYHHEYPTPFSYEIYAGAYDNQSFSPFTAPLPPQHADSSYYFGPGNEYIPRSEFSRFEDVEENPQRGPDHHMVEDYDLDIISAQHLI